MTQLTVGMLKEALKDIPDDTPIWSGSYYYGDMENVRSIILDDAFEQLLIRGKLPTIEHKRPDGTVYYSPSGSAYLWYSGERLYLDTYSGSSSIYYYAPESNK